MCYVRHFAPVGAIFDGDERIDLIAADRALFADEAEPERPKRRRAPWSAIGAVAVVGLATFVLWPRPEPPEWRVFRPAPVPAAGLSDELTFDRPPGPIGTVELAPPPVDLKPEAGFVFGEPGGTITTRRWALFRTKPSSLPPAPASAGLASVNGVPADIRRVRVRHELTWGPIDGRLWSATTNHLDEQEALDFANHVGYIDRSPAIAHRFDLNGMEPVGSVAALDCVVLLTDLLNGEHGRGAELPTVITWLTLDGSISLGSIAAPSDALPLVEFVLGDGRPTVVHNQPAVFIASRTGANPVIAWIENGRLIMVTGDDTDEKLMELAESVRPATTREWRTIARASLREPIGDLFGDGVRLFRGDDGATGDEFDVTANIFAPGSSNTLFVVCVNTIDGETAGLLQWCNSSPPVPPLLFVTEPVNGRRFVVALVAEEEAEGAAVRIQLTDGSYILVPLGDFGDQLPGWAVAELLPRDFGVIELWSGGAVVASL